MEWKCNTEFGEHTNKIKKIIIKRVKAYSYSEKLEKLGIISLLERRMRGDLIEAFKMINVISNCRRHFFSISTPTGNLQSMQISKTKFVNLLDLFN